MDGSFAIDALPSNRLIISFIGMETQTLAIGNRNEFLVKMQPKVDELEEVAVVAFGKQKKESVIGAITTVTPKDLKIPSSNLTTALAGRVAGLIATQRSGEPVSYTNLDVYKRQVLDRLLPKSFLPLAKGI